MGKVNRKIARKLHQYLVQNYLHTNPNYNEPKDSRAVNALNKIIGQGVTPDTIIVDWIADIMQKVVDHYVNLAKGLKNRLLYFAKVKGHSNADNVAKAMGDYLAECNLIIMQEVANALLKLAEECVRRIRDRSQEESWIDHTANLRSSIGYSFSLRGNEVVRSMFRGTKEGATEANRFLDDLEEMHFGTYYLVIVAGMSYAEYVEAIESKDVLESTRIWAGNQIDARLMRAIDFACNQIGQGNFTIEVQV